MKFVMKQFHELDESDPDPRPAPTTDKVEWPDDIDQYEHPYNYDNELPDDAETEEELEQVRESWGLKCGS
jgi:hypothetical protein